MKIEKYSELYTAIESAIDNIFNGEIQLNDPKETLDKVIDIINYNLEG